MTPARRCLALTVAPLISVLLACGTSTEGQSAWMVVDGGASTTSTDSSTPQFIANGQAPAFMATPADAGSSARVVVPTGPVTDFPQPLVDGTAPPGSAALFGPTSQGAAAGGPCLVEPEDNALFPQNWLRPRFRWTSANGETLFELRIHAANQLSDLVVYTSQTTWTMPQAAWDALRTHSPTEAMTVSLRGGVLAGAVLQQEALGSQTTMGIAPVAASGAIAYWTTNDATTGSSALKGFSAGDESVTTILIPSQFAQRQGKASACIGCHSSTPDGQYVAFTTTQGDQSQWADAVGLLDPDGGNAGAAPPYLTPSGASALARWNEGAVAFSAAHWSTGDRRAVVSFDHGGNGVAIDLSWVDLEAASPSTASGILARSGDSQPAAAPSWSHDGNTIVYVSTNRICTGRLGNCTPQYDAPVDVGSRADLYTVPYAAGSGGIAIPLQGAADPSLQEYYPAFSPDDRWVAFNRIPADHNLYNQPAAEIFVVPSGGGMPTRIAANDPPQCSGLKSPGLTNSWAKWAPDAAQAHGDTYYWLVFSSKRIGGHVPQLYMAALVQHAGGALTTYGAVYLWNQPQTEANHTPAWDRFNVPSMSQLR